MSLAKSKLHFSEATASISRKCPFKSRFNSSWSTEPKRFLQAEGLGWSDTRESVRSSVGLPFESRTSDILISFSREKLRPKRSVRVCGFTTRKITKTTGISLTTCDIQNTRKTSSYAMRASRCKMGKWPRGSGGEGRVQGASKQSAEGQTSGGDGPGESGPRGAAEEPSVPNMAIERRTGGLRREAD